MNPFWLLRMALWARNPPSAKRVAFVLAIVAACLLLYLVERTLGWPDFLTLDRMGRFGPGAR